MYREDSEGNTLQFGETKSNVLQYLIKMVKAERKRNWLKDFSISINLDELINARSVLYSRPSLWVNFTGGAFNILI